MFNPKLLPAGVICTLVLASATFGVEPLTVEGGPTDTGFNVGTPAGVRATLKGVTGDPSRYAVFAQIQYIGTTAVASFQLDREGEAQDGEVHFAGGWPIPADAPTGVYRVKLQVEDRKVRKVVATQEVRGFAAYRKLASIMSVRLDKTFYTVGETIQCEVAIRNLTGSALSGLRVEFSNANYPWISTYSGEANLSGKPQENPELGLRVLRENLDLPAQGEATVPMMPAGTAQFMQGKMVALLGAGGPERNAKEPPPEVDQYTVAVWNADRTVLYDMQFSKPAIVRTATSDLPKPYSNLAYTHPYNSDIDFTKYREFYPPGEVSDVIQVDGTRTMFRQGDAITARVKLHFPRTGTGNSWQLSASIKPPEGLPIFMPPAVLFEAPPGSTREVEIRPWTSSVAPVPGVYSMQLTLADSKENKVAETTTDFAVNALPASILVVAPHEDDEHSYAGLIRAAVEAGIPVRVIILTGGDVGECERYFFKPCGPNEAREFGMVRMEESAEALEHIGLGRDKLSILGLPDGGSGEIWFHHAKIPYLSVYLASDHAPYTNVAKPNLPFSRQAVLAELEQLIEDFHPAMIATAHPDERHVDHRTTNWFVIKACQELLRHNQLSPETVILADQAYGAGGYKPAPYHYEKAPVYLSGEAAALKQEMGWIYQSQDGNLDEGAKKTWSELQREEMHYRIMDWQEHEGWNE